MIGFLLYIGLVMVVGVADAAVLRNIIPMLKPQMGGSIKWGTLSHITRLTLSNFRLISSLVICSYVEH